MDNGCRRTNGIACLYYKPKGSGELINLLFFTYSMGSSTFEGSLRMVEQPKALWASKGLQL